jgi:xanthine dehydrogenase YagR molybdenum-binding subunit
LSFALEQAVDEAARRLGRDPIALRQKWDPDPGRQRLYRWAAELPVWQREPRRTGRFRRGVGVAAANWLYLWESDCAVALSVRGGRLTVSTAVQDMGTGSRSVLAATVAAGLGLAPSDVDVQLGDSALPVGPGSGGSRTTATIAPAALAAVAKLKAELVTRSRLSGAHAAADGIRYAGGVLPWPEVIAAADDLRVEAKRPPDDATLGRRAPRAMAGGGVLGALFPVMMRLQGPLRIGRGYPGGVQVVEVEVDTKLGRTRVLRVHGGIAAGKLAVPELAAAQARGGIIQGVGFALYEERQFDLDTGLVLSANLEDYRIPGIADLPEIQLHFDTEGYEHVPGGGVGLGEVATIPVAAAIANAVYDATGVRQYELPLRPDRVLSGREAT